MISYFSNKLLSFGIEPDKLFSTNFSASGDRDFTYANFRRSLGEILMNGDAQDWTSSSDGSKDDEVGNVKEKSSRGDVE